LGMVREKLGHLVDTVLAEAGSRPLDSHAFRLNIERAFSVKGCGTVVTGVPISGEVAVGDKLELLPGSVTTTVRGVQKFGHDARAAFAHECVALNLRDVDVDAVPRGTTVCRPGLYRAVSVFLCTLENIDDAKSIGRRAKVKLHVGTSVANASLVLLKTEKLTPAQRAFARVKVERPLVLTAGDRFIVRKLSPPTTIGGGIVLSIDVQKRARRSPHLDRALELARDALESGDLFSATLALSPARGISSHELVTQTRCGGSLAEQLIAEKEAAGTIVNLGQSWLVRSRLPEIAERMKNALSRFHKRNRYAWGMAPTQVCRVLDVGPKDFTGLAEELARADPGIVVRNGLLALDSHEPALSKPQAALKDAIVLSVTTAGMTPPTRGNLANELGASPSDMRLLVRLLITEGAVTTAGSYLVSTAAFEQYRAKLLDLFSKDTSIDVKSFREATGASRRLAVAILETFDSKGLTRRVGQSRVLKSP
ncbi:SelB C-terminal domain-containing protein, partial [Planctomycetota bacterium]